MEVRLTAGVKFIKRVWESKTKCRRFNDKCCPISAYAGRMSEKKNVIVSCGDRFRDDEDSQIAGTVAVSSAICAGLLNGRDVN